MTTTASVRAEIARFLSSETPEVLAITGKWGVGKTFTWDLDLKAVQRAGELRMDRYAYVSLFGLNSLEDLRYAIFENTVAADQLAGGPTRTTLMARVHWLEKNARQFSYLLNALPYAKDILHGSKSAFLAVRDQLVCIDDLERHGKNLELKDVLGLVSQLKEQRHCKVALLLNQEELPEKSAADFAVQLEKVVDVRVTFEPTPQEAAEIGLLPDTDVAKYLEGDCRALGIRNIRVIKKIERDSRRLAGLLEDFGPLVLKQAIHTATLFGWIHYQPQEAPPFDFVKAHNSIAFMMRGNKEGTDAEKAWHALLSAYEFTNVDHFDEVIVNGIHEGYFDGSALQKEAQALAAQLDAYAQENSFHSAWELYHNSFRADADEVLRVMAEAFQRGVNTISPINLNATIALFKELGRGDQAKELLAYYMGHRQADAKFFDLEQSAFGEEVTDPDVRQAFENKFEAFVDDRNPKQILIDIVVRSGWNPEDLARIEKLSAGDFKDLFKDNDGMDLRRMIQAALQFRTMQGVDVKTKAMSARAEEALREIGAESALNARRVAKYGIKIPAEGANKEEGGAGN